MNEAPGCFFIFPVYLFDCSPNENGETVTTPIGWKQGVFLFFLKEKNASKLRVFIF